MRLLAIIFLLGFGGLARAESTEAIFTAGFADRVHRYGHDALGPGHEWGALAGTWRQVPFRHVLPDDLVFEDLSPEITDMNRDGIPEMLVTESSLTLGSRLALWGPDGRLAAGPFIGTRHRWLAMIGVADFDGDGRDEVAYVEMPHLAKVLKLAHLDGDTFTVFAQAEGLSNHRFGQDVIESVVVPCGRTALIALPNGDFTRLMLVRLEQGKLVVSDAGSYEGTQSFTNLPICN